MIRAFVCVFMVANLCGAKTLPPGAVCQSKPRSFSVVWNVRDQDIDGKIHDVSRWRREMANREFVFREVPPPCLEWGDANADVAKMEAKFEELRRKDAAERLERERKERQKKEESEREEWRIRNRIELEKAQLAQVEADMKAFADGDAEAAMRVSFYYAGYSYKLSDNGRGVEAACMARESYRWLCRSADAGCARAQARLGALLMNGRSMRSRGPFMWSGMVPDIPPDNAYIHPGAFQGTDVPVDVLYSKTNGVSRYYRVCRRDPELGLKYMKLAEAQGDWEARSWISDRRSNRCDLSMPSWWLARDGFGIRGREAEVFEEVETRRSPGGVVRRKIGKDAQGGIVSVSDEYFADPHVGRRTFNPWHESGPDVIVTEELP